MFLGSCHYICMKHVRLSRYALGKYFKYDLRDVYVTFRLQLANGSSGLVLMTAPSSSATPFVPSATFQRLRTYYLSQGANIMSENIMSEGRHPRPSSSLERSPSVVLMMEPPRAVPLSPSVQSEQVLPTYEPEPYEVTTVDASDSDGRLDSFSEALEQQLFRDRERARARSRSRGRRRCA